LQLLETKRKEQSDSKRRQLLTTSLTGHPKAKFLEELKVSWDWSFRTCVPQWLIVSQGRLCDLALIRKGAFLCFQPEKAGYINVTMELCFPNTSDTS